MDEKQLLLNKMNSDNESNATPQKQAIDSNKNIFQNITFNWIKQTIKNIKNKNSMTNKDICPLSESMMSSIISKNFTNDNKNFDNKTIFNLIFCSNKETFITMLVFVPLISLCAICSPIAIRQFTGFLSPSSFYNCDKVFTDNPQFEFLPYSKGLSKSINKMWGYIVLVFVSQLFQTIFQNIIFHFIIKVTVTSLTGLLDTMYQKILSMSNQSRQNQDMGNLINLLFTDTTKISTLISNLPMIYQIPIDLVVTITYMIAQINVHALYGLITYFIIFPLTSFVINKMIVYQKHIMSLRDQRIQRSGEVLNGIKIIKLFCLENQQLTKMKDVRSKEISMIYKNAICNIVFILTAFISSPVMTTIAFLALSLSHQFDTGNAFTVMFLYRSLSMNISMLPMQLSALSDAFISQKRIQSFLQLKEKNLEDIVKVQYLTYQQQTQLIQNQIISETTAIKIVGKPSFAWSVQDDKIIPAVFDSQYNKNQALLKKIKKTYQKLLKTFKHSLESKLNDIEDKQLAILFMQIEDNQIQCSDKIDQLCKSNNITPISQINSVKQYDATQFNGQKNKIVLQYLHLKTIQQIIDQKIDQREKTQIVLKDVEMEINKGEIVGIYGKVGSGKSSLFNAILGEMCIVNSEYSQDYDDQQTQTLNQEQSKLIINGKIGYFPQVPILFSMSIIDNILFGQPYNQYKYENIIQICCLVEDFKILQMGDQTLVGGKGITLSGGQKARICLARVLYTDPEIILLDDPLSAVDAHVGKNIWDQVIMGYCKQNKISVLIASHHTKYFKDCDKIMKISDRQIQYIHTVEQSLNQDISAYETSSFSQSKLVSCNNNKQFNDSSDSDQLQVSQHNQEQIIRKDKQVSIYLKWIKSGNLTLAIFMLIFVLVNQGVLQYQGILISDWSTDKYHWTKQEKTKSEYLNLIEKSSIKCDQNVNIPSEYCHIDSVQFKNLFVQIKENAGEGLQIIKQCYEEKGAHFVIGNLQPSNKYSWLYFGLTIMLVFTGFSQNASFARFSLSASKKLYDQMFKALIYAKMTFYDITPQGRILNRLSKDTDTVDQNIMRLAQSGLMTSAIIFGMLISMVCVNLPCIVVIVPCVIVFIVIYQNFRKVFPHIKRFEATTRSPIYNLCNETVDGLICVRSFEVEQYLLKQFRQSVDQFGFVFLLQQALLRNITFKLCMLTMTFSTTVILVSVLVSPYNQNTAQYTGVIVSYVFSISQMLYNVVITLITLEGEMASVQRIQEYENIQVERSNQMEHQTQQVWPPKKAVIEVKNLNLRYRKDLNYVLKNINFTIYPGEHIGVVGRTGAGKSSLASALCRLVECEQDSQVCVNNINILDLPINHARQVFSVIPQDSFLFSGTLRDNLNNDQERNNTDAQIWDILDQVQLKQFFINQQQGLDFVITNNGSNLSSGQIQLVCIARALLRQSSCLILDEATAQIDKDTDVLIQQMMKQLLKNVTVIAIAHRMETILDFNRIMVFDNGKIIEFDNPVKLLKNENGLFSQLCRSAGVTKDLDVNNLDDKV